MNIAGGTVQTSEGTHRAQVERLLLEAALRDGSVPCGRNPLRQGFKQMNIGLMRTVQ
jgi:hypothetical protein